MLKEREKSANENYRFSKIMPCKVSSTARGSIQEYQYSS